MYNLELAPNALQIQALRIWRSCTDQGLMVFSMDEMYQLLCHDFVYPELNFEAEALTSSEWNEARRKLQTAAEAWKVATSLLRSDVYGSQLMNVAARHDW